MTAVKSQRGAVLIITLLMLTVIMLLAVGSVNQGTMSLRIVDNMRTVQEQEAAVQQAAEQLISDPDNFRSGSVKTFQVNGMDVRLSEPVCMWSQVVEGSSAAVEGQQQVDPPEDVYWEFDACIVQGGNCAGPVISQGVRMRMVAGQCG